MATETGNRNHSAVFPKSLPEWFIRLFTRSGDMVLDPFMGSGTTVIVAQELGRNAIGIEIMPEYVELAQQALANIQPSLL
jgi:DNA modification methylase